MFRNAAISLICAASLAACEPGRNPGVSESLVTQSSETVLPYAFTPGTAQITRASRNHITGLLDGLRLTERDILVISVPDPAGQAGTAARKAGLRAVMARYPARLKLVDGGGPSGEGVVTDRGIIRVIRAYAVDTACTAPAGMIGCANAENLAQMVAVPADVMYPTLGRRFIAAKSDAAIPPGIEGVTP